MELNLFLPSLYRCLKEKKSAFVEVKSKGTGTKRCEIEHACIKPNSTNKYCIS